MIHIVRHIRTSCSAVYTLLSKWISTFSGHYGRVLMKLQSQHPTLAIAFTLPPGPLDYGMTLSFVPASYLPHNRWPYPYEL